MFEVNNEIIYKDEAVFDEFMKCLNNMFVIFYTKWSYVESSAVQEVIQQLYAGREEYIKSINSDWEEVIEKISWQ